MLISVNLNKVINDFYDALVKVRYPGVATIEPGNLEKTVLDKNLRNQLLHWLLVESLKSIDSSANEPQADDGLNIIYLIFYHLNNQ